MNEAVCQTEQWIYETAVHLGKDAPSLKEHIIRLIETNHYDALVRAFIKSAQEQEGTK